MSWLSDLLGLVGWRPKPGPPKPPDPPITPPVKPPGDLSGYDYFEQLNRARNANNVPSAIPTQEGMCSAKVQSDKQARRDEVSHAGPPGMPGMTDRMDHCGVKYGACGECVSGYPFPETVPRWLNSPGHRRIILDRTYTHGGAAESRSDATGRPYTTCVFYSVRTGRRAIVVPEYGGVTEDMIPGEA